MLFKSNGSRYTRKKYYSNQTDLDILEKILF